MKKQIEVKLEETPLKCPYGFTKKDKWYKPTTIFKIIKLILKR